MQEDRGEGEVERDLEVGVGEDDVGVLAAQLEGDPLDGRRRGGHEPAAGLEPAGERDQVDARVRGQRRTGLGPGAQDEVADARAAGRPPPAAASGGSRSAGVSSLGLSTNVLPAARQGATFHETWSSG